jgi:mycofactocin precursor
MIEQEKEVRVQEEEILTVDEIKVEELAIDGICGVY